MVLISFILLVIVLMSIRKVNNEDEIYSINQNLPIRGILVIFVILNHVYESAYMLGNIAVSLFFCFSGYGLIKGYLNKKDYFSGYIMKKVKNIIVPFFLFNIIYIAWNIFALDKNYTLLQILRSFFNATIMPVGWYIIIAFVLYLIFYFVYKYLKINDYKKVTILFFLEVALMIILYILGRGSWWYCSIFAFPLGILMALKNEDVSIKKYIVSKYTFIFSLVILFFTYTYAFYYDLNDGLIFLIIKFLHSILVCIIYFNIFKKYRIDNKILSLIGRNSLIIYMIHPLVYRVIGHFNLSFNLNILNFIFILLISLLFSLMLNLVIKVLFAGGKYDKVKKIINIVNNIVIEIR